MSDKYSTMLLWTFDEGGACTGYYLAEDVPGLGEFFPCYPWEPIEGSVWRTDPEDGEVFGYFVPGEEPIVGTFKDFGSMKKIKTDCSTYDGSHRCEKSRWRRKGCCCIGWGRDEEKIPGTCN